MKTPNPLLSVKRHGALRPISLCCALIMSFGAIAPAFAQGNGQVSLNFVNADLETVAKAVGQATGRNIVVDPRVKGTVNLVTEKPVTKSQALLQLSSMLRMQGYAMVDGNGFMKVVPEADAKLQGNVADAGVVARSAGQIVTQVFRLNYESANNLVPVLRPLISPNNSITAYAANNTLVITDYAENLQRIGKIIAAVDAPASGDIEIIPLKNALAVDVAAILSRMLDVGGADASTKASVMAEPRSNALLVRASSQARVNQVRNLVNKLDLPSARAGNIWVIPLKNAEATKLAPTLRAIVAADSSLTPSATGASPNVANTANTAGTTPPTTANSGTSGATGSFGGSANTASTGGIIQADPSTNSLIITANEPTYRNLRDVVERLDQRRAQIYLESIIVEVSSKKAAEFGLQWQKLLGSGNSQVYAGTNFSSNGNNITALGPTVTYLAGGSTGTAPTTAISAGLNIGLVDKVLGLAALARLMDNQTGVNVLSTPNLLTLDNEEAKISIGQNVPFITGQYAQTGSTSTVTPFQTIERKDVGLTLRVRPQISEGGLIRLQIYQESSAVADTTNAAGIITSKRSFDSNVLVEDGQTIALGGLMEDSYNDGVQKVPGLGDIPLVGALFRYENKSRDKTNLMVFIRPHIIRSGAQNDAIVSDRYDYMRSAANNSRPNAWFLQGGDPPTLPPLDEPQKPFMEQRFSKPLVKTAPAKTTPIKVTGADGATTTNVISGTP